jgi:hypothetical protein
MKSPLNAFLNTSFGKKAVASYANLTFRRWLETLCLMLIIAVFFTIIERPIFLLSTSLAAMSEGLSSAQIIFVVFIISISVSLALMRVGSINPDHSALTMVKYPPIWIVALLGTGTFYFRAATVHHVSLLHILSFYPAEFLLTIVAITGGSLTVLLAKKLDLHFSELKTTSQKLYASPDGKSKQLDSEELDLLHWVINESPINDSVFDHFSHDIQAKRIASLILHDAPASIGIVGPFGSGKSCLINLLIKHLSNDILQRSVLCKIDGWGRASGSISNHILAMAIEKVSHHVDCLSILSLPENYRQAIGEVKAPAGAILAALLKVSHDPIAQLIKLDNLLSVAQLRLVIILEDLDRNVSDKSLKEEIPSLLDRLHNLHHVTFILAIGTEKNYSNILARICDYMEAVA